MASAVRVGGDPSPNQSGINALSAEGAIDAIMADVGGRSGNRRAELILTRMTSP
jgi:hypothetical protein